MADLLSRPAASRVQDALRAKGSRAELIDNGLTRFEVIYAAAGHPHCAFPTSALELSFLTDRRWSGAQQSSQASIPHCSVRSATFEPSWSLWR